MRILIGSAYKPAWVWKLSTENYKFNTDKFLQDNRVDRGFLGKAVSRHGEKKKCVHLLK